MFDALNLRQRTLLLAFAPSLVLAILLGGQFAISQMDRLHEQLIEHGRLLIEHLAPVASEPLQNKDTARLQQLANRTLERADVRAVTLSDNQGQTLVHAGPRIMRNPKLPTPDPQRLNVWRDFQSSVFILPIYAHHQLGDSEQKSDIKHDPLLGWIEIEISHMSALMRGYRGLLISLCFGLVSLLFSILVAAYLARTIYRPIRTISKSIPNNTHDFFTANLPTFNCPDFDKLTKHINILLERIRIAHEENLQYSELPARVLELTQSLENFEVQSIELDLARREAVEGSKIKSEFLTNMSHEIRTPLNGILGFIRQLQKTTLNNQQRDYLNTIEQSSYHLLSVINELLDMSKIEAGKFMLEPTPFNLRDLIQESLNMLAPNAHERNLELVSLIDNRLPRRLIGDLLRLQQVLNNLIGNAIKYTPAGGRVLVRALFEGEVNNQINLQIRIEDNGLGFLPDELRTLFRPFHQLDRNENAQGKGTGLGLAIAKKIIDTMNGDIGVESEYRQGAHFWIRLHLPLAPHQNHTPTLPLALIGHSIPLFDLQTLSHESIANELEELGLDVESCDSLDELIKKVSEQQKSPLPYRLVVIGTGSIETHKEEVKAALYRLAELGCKALLFCPTNEQAFYQDFLFTDQYSILPKPLRTNLLNQSLHSLFQPVQTLQPASTPHIIEGAPHILCVDDHPINLQLIQKILTDMGVTVTAVDNGKAAIEMTEKTDFDMIFMDIQMPDMNGLITTQYIRQKEIAKGKETPVPIIALTAHALSSERGQLLNSGMNDYLSKPVSEQQLLQTLRRWINNNNDRKNAPFIYNDSTDLALNTSTSVHNSALIHQLRQQLIERLPSDWYAIETAKQENELDTLLARVHHLNGAISVCGLPELRQACYDLETLLKQKQPIEEVFDMLRALIQTWLTTTTDRD